ncbi:MAG: hypothetical protein JOY80_03185 [Candidatus Dormibacteraeota bacterium]|nr:hypothetical protein [Candidatus Dormibacteraeota bacterium]
MNIRPASFRDMGRIEELYRQAVERDDSPAQVSEDSPVPQAPLLRVWHALTKSLTSLMPFPDSGDALLVAEDPSEGVIGFIQAQAPQGRTKAWQILNLCTSASAPGHFARQRLIAALCNVGLERGVHRFHVRLPLDHPLVPVFLEEHFTQFATEQILYRDEPPAGTTADGGILRAAKREDIPAIYLLYLRTTPKQVADFEGPSLNTWLAGFAQGDVARLGRDDARHFVVERPDVIAWAEIRPASTTRPAQLTLMCEGQDAGVRNSVVDAVLAELPSGPAACVLRHYDSELIRSLREHGFDVYGSQLLLVRDLGTRVRVRQAARQKKPMLVRAGVAQSVPVTEPSVPLRVLTTSAQRRQRSSRT